MNLKKDDYFYPKMKLRFWMKTLQGKKSTLR
jgi:hypothetical protein